jgi:hypothetical protein
MRINLTTKNRTRTDFLLQAENFVLEHSNSLLVLLPISFALSLNLVFPILFLVALPSTLFISFLLLASSDQFTLFSLHPHFSRRVCILKIKGPPLALFPSGESRGVILFPGLSLGTGQYGRVLVGTDMEALNLRRGGGSNS